MVRIKEQIFKGKQHIPWKDVEKYLKPMVGKTITVEEYGDNITVPSDFPGEFASSEYTKKLKGGLAKIKANAAQVLEELVRSGTKRRFVENKDAKHNHDAIGGWYRYDVFFQSAVKSENEKEIRWNSYRATLVVRANDSGWYLHDIVNIKKEASTPVES